MAISCLTDKANPSISLFFGSVQQLYLSSLIGHDCMTMFISYTPTAIAFRFQQLTHFAEQKSKLENLLFDTNVKGHCVMN